jgi:hypothetical protein
MKRVRYMIGAAGVVPVLGLVTPAAYATVRAPYAPKDSGKSVSLHQGARPLLTCGHNHIVFASTSNNLLFGQIGYSGQTCIHSQWAQLNKRQSGLTERVRYYSGGGAMEATYWRGGHFTTSQTTFFSSVQNIDGREACQALVANSNHNDVKYGPVCEKI